MAILLAWVKFGRKIIPLRSLVSIPFYILSKIPIYLRFLIKPEQRWIRTERDAIGTALSVKQNIPTIQNAELAYKE